MVFKGLESRNFVKIAKLREIAKLRTSRRESRNFAIPFESCEIFLRALPLLVPYHRNVPGTGTVLYLYSLTFLFQGH